MACLQPQSVSAPSRPLARQQHPIFRPGAEQGLIHADQGVMKRSEARLGSAQVQRSFTIGEDRVLVARTDDADGSPRVVFARMAYEPDLREWYPAETWDRPDTSGFAWAHLTLGNGQQVFVWDEKPIGAEISLEGEPLGAEAAAGAVVWEGSLSPEEVTVK